MANGSGIFGWIEGVIAGLVLSAVGGVVKLIRLDQRVKSLEKREEICTKTHDKVIILMVEVKNLQKGMDRLLNSQGKPPTGEGG